MKTWVKVLIVIILMACASGATCLVFYNNLKKNNKIDYTITNYFASSERVMFNEELQEAKTNCNDSRMKLVCDTLYNLEEILEDCNYYLINYYKKVEDKHEIIKEFENITNQKTQIYSMLVEYNTKSANSTSFDKSTGSNDLYVSFANFFIKYAGFIQLINSRICGVVESDSSDIKFSVVELYSQVVKDSFSEIKEVKNLKTIANSDNIDLMNNLIVYSNGQIQLATDIAYFGSSSTLFIMNYNLCDKHSFAKNLSDNVDSISGDVSNMTTIERATHYFKEIFGF